MPVVLFSSLQTSTTLARPDSAMVDLPERQSFRANRCRRRVEIKASDVVGSLVVRRGAAARECPPRDDHAAGAQRTGLDGLGADLLVLARPRVDRDLPVLVLSEQAESFWTHRN